MNVYYSTALPRESFLKEAFAREGVALPDPLPRTKNGKPYLPRSAVQFSLTHTDGLLAVAFGEAVGLDAEKRKPRKADALFLRLTEEERAEDLYVLWTAKESYVKYRGGTLAEFLPRLVFRRGALLLDGAPVRESLLHFEVEGCTLCLCTPNPVQAVPVLL